MKPSDYFVCVCVCIVSVCDCVGESLCVIFKWYLALVTSLKYTSYYSCGGLVVGIGSYARSGIGEVVNLFAAVHYISRGAVIWDPPKSVKRPLTLCIHCILKRQRQCNAPVGFEPASLWLVSSRAEFCCHALRAARHAPEHLI